MTFLIGELGRSHGMSGTVWCSNGPRCHDDLMYSKKVIDAVAPLLCKYVDMGNKQLVISNLAFMQQAMIAIEGLIQNAIKLTDGPIRDYFISHLKEESDH